MSNIVVEKKNLRITSKKIKAVNMKRCELNGCVYNENGTCKYDEALIKVASATACYENFSEEE